jgi:hypothetical protein
VGRNMDDDILNLYSQFKEMPSAYLDIRAVENMTSAVGQWAMLDKLCQTHKLVPMPAPTRRLVRCDD